MMRVDSSTSGYYQGFQKPNLSIHQLYHLSDNQLLKNDPALWSELLLLRRNLKVLNVTGTVYIYNDHTADYIIDTTGN
jgi:hypothetical protein